MRSLQSILNILSQHKVTNIEVLDSAWSISIEAMILKTQLRWVGHVIRMDDQRLPKHLLFGELCSGRRNRGRPRKRFKDCVKANVAHAGIDPKQLESEGANRESWRALTYQAQDSFESKRRQDVNDARERRKLASTSVPLNPGQFICPHCARACLSRIGLQSHLRSHTRKNQA